jgi:hypothetical protein
MRRRKNVPYIARVYCTLSSHSSHEMAWRYVAVFVCLSAMDVSMRKRCSLEGRHERDDTGID